MYVCSQHFYRKDYPGRHMKMHQPAGLFGDSAACLTDATVDLPLPPSPPPKWHGETPMCDLCAKKFPGQKRHRPTDHCQSGGFSCQVCNQRFYWRDHFRPLREVWRNGTHFQERGDQAIGGGRAHAGLRQTAWHDHALMRSDQLLQGRQDLAGHALAEILSGRRVGGDSHAPSTPVALSSLARTFRRLRVYFLSGCRCRPQSKDPEKEAKLVGNAGFGRFIMDVTRHQEVKYDQDESKVAVLSTVSSFMMWKNWATRCSSSRCTRRRSSATCLSRSVSLCSLTPSYPCWNSITIALIPFWIGETFSTWKWIPILATCLWLATHWKRRPGLPPFSPGGFPTMTRRSTFSTRSGWGQFTFFHAIFFFSILNQVKKYFSNQVTSNLADLKTYPSCCVFFM